MRAIAIRTLASVLATLVAVPCGTVRRSRQPGLEERVFLPHAPRVVASPVVDEAELQRAVEELLPYVDLEATQTELRRMVAEPRFHGRRPEDLRLVLAGWGSGPVALEELARGYRAFCAATHRTNCVEGPLTASSVYQIAFDFALGSQWDGFVGEVKGTFDPSTIRIVLLTGMVIFMATIAIPELLSKIPAAAATMVLTAYLGARAVCGLVFGWIQMVRELDAAATFDQVRAAGQRYGHLVGAQTARILILLATAAISEGGLIARLMRLPRAAQASAALAAETGGVALEAVGGVKDVRVLQGGVAIAVGGITTGAVGVAMAAHGTPPSPGTTATKKFEIRKYKDMPRPRPAGTEAHHGMLNKWMEKHSPKYQPGEAPSVLMEDEAHHLTRGVFNKWKALMTERMGGAFDWSRVSEAEIKNLSEQMFEAAGVPMEVRQEFWKQFDQYNATLAN